VVFAKYFVLYFRHYVTGVVFEVSMLRKCVLSQKKTRCFSLTLHSYGKQTVSLSLLLRRVNKTV
jgi:hypothetical protein